MEKIQIISIVLEAVIVFIALSGFVFKKKFYMAGFALTFGIYVYYDLAKLNFWPVSPSLLYPLFLIATISALLSVLHLFKK